MNCPHCKAKIEENAHFCIFCMTSLDEKEAIAPFKRQIKRWWPMAVSALLVLLLGLGVWLLWPSKKPAKTAAPGEVVAGQAEQQDQQAPSVEPPTEETPTVETPSVETPSVETPSVETPTVEKPTVENPTVESPTKQPEQKPIETPQQPSVEKPVEQEPPKEEQTPPPAEEEPSQPKVQFEEVGYYYREAKDYDYDPVSTGIPMENAIVVMGFDREPESGIYCIPATIDGKIVIGIDMGFCQGHAFTDYMLAKRVKKVYLPPSIVKIYEETFSECDSMTDLYYAGEALEMDPAALPPNEDRKGTLTFHCSETAVSLNGGGKLSARYDAAYESWQGSEVYDM
ncbi:MAG: hypothetical protein IJN82_03425 [Clostridia bacterium]|nr:hypothetical protein [Clostridia bacterium]